MGGVWFSGYSVNKMIITDSKLAIQDRPLTGRTISTAVCILGMHRSGTSCVARAVNLLGVQLGKPAGIDAPGPDNPMGFWENLEIRRTHELLLSSFGRTWDTAHPLPAGWEKTTVAMAYQDTLAKIITVEFSGYSLWGWKDPRTCLLLPVWRNVLRSSPTNLKCLFTVRNPVDVAKSLEARNGIPFNAAIGIWFHYNLAALRNISGLPAVFLNYEHFLIHWESELRRVVDSLGLPWPADTAALRREVEAFLDPKLRHNRSAEDGLGALPKPARRLYQVLSAAAKAETADLLELEQTGKELSDQFRAYASLLEPIPSPQRPSWLRRTCLRWQRSIRKRLPGAKA